MVIGKFEPKQAKGTTLVEAIRISFFDVVPLTMESSTTTILLPCNSSLTGLNFILTLLSLSSLVG